MTNQTLPVNTSPSQREWRRERKPLARLNVPGIVFILVLAAVTIPVVWVALNRF